MALTDLPFKAGFMSNPPDRGVGTLGYWKGGDRVRFKDGLPETIGGWVSDNIDQAMQGSARGAIDWLSLRDERFIAFGTNLKLYVWVGGQFYDITPIRASSTINNNPFATTDGLPDVVVTDTAHGAIDGAFVTFSGAAAVAGITISGEYQLTYIDANSYSITHSANANATTTGGGASVVAAYQINPGNEESSIGLGWGADTWGADTWGTPRTISDLTAVARVWTLDTWGEDLIACHFDGNIYVWDSSAGTGTRATLILQAPTDNKAVFVSQEARHVVALGAGGDPLAIEWCSSEDYTDWTPTTTNTAGDKRVDKGSQLLRAVKAKDEHLLFTDEFVYAMQYVGPPYTFAVRGVGLSGGLAGPNAMAVYTDVCYWMGDKGFYLYDGTIRPLPCSVFESVFNNFNKVQAFQVWAGVNARHNEVWWVYCSNTSDTIDRYVAYNTLEKTWITGTLDRTLFVGDSDVISYPYAITLDGMLVYHEFGVAADGADLGAYIESGDVEISKAGEMLMHVGKLVPDFKRLTGEVDVTVTTKKYPQAAETQSSGAIAVGSSTEFINPRVRGRQMSVRIENAGPTSSWRMGVLRLELKPHGRR